MLKHFAISYIMSFVGTWYKWGGDDPSGFDCSGLAVEMLKAVGIIERKSDYTAAMLFDKFKDKRVDVADKGCLVFYANSAGKIVHVEISIYPGLTIGASGGGSRTLTVQDAMKQNAFVKVRPQENGRPIAGIVDPFMGES